MPNPREVRFGVEPLKKIVWLSKVLYICLKSTHTHLVVSFYLFSSIFLCSFFKGTEKTSNLVEQEITRNRKYNQMQIWNSANFPFLNYVIKRKLMILSSYEIERNLSKWKEKGESQEIRKPIWKRCCKNNSKI